MKRKILAGLCVGPLLLAGCGDLQNPLNLFGDGAVDTIALHGGAVQAVPSDGFCIDSRSSRPNTGFAMIAPCATLAGETPTVAALGTIQVGPSETASVTQDPQAFEAFLKGEGKSLLSPNGETKNLLTNVEDNVVIAVFEDTGTQPVTGTLTQEARAFLDINDRLVTVAFRSIAAKPISLETVRALVRDTVTSLRDANS